MSSVLTSVPAGATPPPNSNTGGGSGNTNTGAGGSNTSGGNTSTSSSNTSGLPSTTEISGFKVIPLISGGEPVAGQTYEVTAKVSVKIPKNVSGKKTLYLFGKTSRHGVKQSVVVKATITELPATGAQPQFMLLIAVAAIFGGFGVRRLRRVS